jgi:hypothetical protein
MPRPGSLAFPNLIGCAIAGGDPVVYQGLIHRFAEANPDIAVYIVTFDPASRERQQGEQFRKAGSDADGTKADGTNAPPAE